MGGGEFDRDKGTRPWSSLNGETHSRGSAREKRERGTDGNRREKQSRSTRGGRAQKGVLCRLACKRVQKSRNVPRPRYHLCLSGCV